MGFRSIIEWAAHGLEGMGIAVVAVGGLAAIVSFSRRLIAGNAFEAEGEGRWPWSAARREVRALPFSGHG